MDKLDMIFSLQKRFDDDLALRRGLHDIPADVWIQRETLAMLSELAELLDEVNFKWWKDEKPIDERRIKEELVDILHFFTSMCLKMGMTAQELHDMYLEKNSENFERQKGNTDREGYASGA